MGLPAFLFRRADPVLCLFHKTFLEQMPERFLERAFRNSEGLPDLFRVAFVVVRKEAAAQIERGQNTFGVVPDLLVGFLTGESMSFPSLRIPVTRTLTVRPFFTVSFRSSLRIMPL